MEGELWFLGRRDKAKLLRKKGGISWTCCGTLLVVLI